MEVSPRAPLRIDIPKRKTNVKDEVRRLCGVRESANAYLTRACATMLRNTIKDHEIVQIFGQPRGAFHRPAASSSRSSTRRSLWRIFYNAFNERRERPSSSSSLSGGIEEGTSAAVAATTSNAAAVPSIRAALESPAPGAGASGCSSGGGVLPSALLAFAICAFQVTHSAGLLLSVGLF